MIIRSSKEFEERQYNLKEPQGMQRNLKEHKGTQKNTKKRKGTQRNANVPHRIKRSPKEQLEISALPYLNKINF